MSYSSDWLRTAMPGTWRGWASSTSTRGATATFRFEGRSVAWVSATLPHHRLAEIRIDDVLVTTLDLYAAEHGPARVVWAHDFATPGEHVLEIRMVNSTSRPAAQLVIDGFYVVT